jgi:hypothetical protein
MVCVPQFIESRVVKILLPLLLISTSVLADDAGLLRCRGVSDVSARLACYDALPVGEAKTAEAVPRQTPEQFGMEQVASKSDLESIESHIPGHFEGWEPRTRIRLANGQIWQISDGSRRPLDFQNPKVSVRRGVLGAFYLEIEGTNSSPRVKRLQ